MVAENVKNARSAKREGEGKNLENVVEIAIAVKGIGVCVLMCACGCKPSMCFVEGTPFLFQESSPHIWRRSSPEPQEEAGCVKSIHLNL